MHGFWLAISLSLILLGAKVFTNGIEWLGKKLKLAEGAVGSLLAAVGTALPETMIPIIAIVFGDGNGVGHEIGIGAILGAPFMLGTLAFFLAGAAAYIMRHRRQNLPLQIDPIVLRRDLLFFLLVYSGAILAALIPSEVRKGVAVALVGAYLFYGYLTLRNGQTLGEQHNVAPLYFGFGISTPLLWQILLQVLLALGIIILGAKVFVDEVKQLAQSWGISATILALIIAPIATELPEKFNSFIWIREEKDTLALGNITGAMVFQSSMIPALGIVLTPWVLNWESLLSAVLVLASTSIIYYRLRVQGCLTPSMLMLGGCFYLTFLGIIFFFRVI